MTFFFSFQGHSFGVEMQISNKPNLCVCKGSNIHPQREIVIKWGEGDTTGLLPSGY